MHSNNHKASHFSHKHPSREFSRRQAYYKGKYRKEIFYIGLSVVLIIIASQINI